MEQQCAYVRSRVKNDSWKRSVIYFVLIRNTGVLLVSSGNSRVIISMHAMMTYTNMHELDIHMN